MTLGKLEILTLFKENVLKFLDALVELFPEESDLIVVRILFENQIPIEESLNVFSSRILPARDMIINKNEQFFLRDDNVFMGINNDKVIRWKKIWLSKKLDNDDKETIWKWLKIFLSLSEMYVNN